MRRLKKKFITCIRQTNGESMVSTAVLVMLIMILATVIGEYMRVYATASQIKENMDAAVRHVVTCNWDRLFPGVREGYEGSASRNTLTDKSVVSEVAAVMNAEPSGPHEYAYRVDNRTVYSIKELNLTFTNASFEGIENMTVTAAAAVEIPFMIGGLKVFPVSLKMVAEVDYNDIR